MGFHLIDMQNWERKNYYNHYMHKLRCTYSITANIDISGLREAAVRMQKKIYPLQIYMLATVVNSYPEFRMNTDSDGNLGYWDELNPSYTIFNKETELFSSIWTGYSSSFSEFYENCTADIARFSGAECLNPKPEQPLNIFTVSSLPWTTFTGFNLNVFTDGCYLPPIFTIGKFFEEGGKIMMPLAMQAHHSVCDGFHTCRFINSLQELSDNYGRWIEK